MDSRFESRESIFSDLVSQPGQPLRRPRLHPSPVYFGVEVSDLAELSGWGCFVSLFS